MYCWFHHARLVENTPTSTIRAAVQGYVELSGKAQLIPGPRIISPSGKQCVWYSHYICDYEAEDPFSYLWKVVKYNQLTHKVSRKEVSDELFLLDDKTAQCIIDPDYADVIPTRKTTWYENKRLTSHTEYWIEVGDSLSVMGLFETHGHIEANHEKEALKNLLREWKQDVALMGSFDHNQDGAIDMAEWESVRKAAKRTIKKEHIQSEKHQLLNFVRDSGKKNQPFILSTKPESSLILKYYGRACASLVGFIASGSLAVWAFNLRMAS